MQESRYQNNVAKSLSNFLDKAIKAGGYYIGRYETGDLEATNERISSSGDTSTPVIQKGKWPYNFINQNQASSLSQNMYNNNNFSNDLVNSYAYDTALVFIQTFGGDEDYSIQNGANSIKSIQKTGENILSIDNNLDIKCNIYDMCGNTREWTTETADLEDSCSVLRGSYFGENNFYTSSRSKDSQTSIYSGLSFRGILYL